MLCEAYLTTIEDFSHHIDSGEQIDVILLDFFKAFDKVPHQHLFVKLAHYGIRDLPWYLNGSKTFSQIEHKRLY